jgi:hypothetical protein
MVTILPLKQETMFHALTKQLKIIFIKYYFKRKRKLEQTYSWLKWSRRQYIFLICCIWRLQYFLPEMGCKGEKLNSMIIILVIKIYCHCLKKLCIFSVFKSFGNHTES